MGFRVWLEGINLNSDTPIPSSTGDMLERGQAALRVVALINGKEVTGGFGGAQQSVIMMKPPVIFDHNLFDTEMPNLSDSPAGVDYLSYDSSLGLLPHTAASPPPAANQNASVRSLDSISLGGSARVYGEIVLPPDGTVGGVAPSGSHGDIRLLDEVHVPYRFIPPNGTDEDSPAADIDVDSDLTLPPGIHGDVYVSSGVTLTLERGGEYTFLGSGGLLELADGANLVLGGTSTDPCVVYAHSFYVGQNCRINMPATPTDPPRPIDLQFYHLTWRGCVYPDTKLGPGTEAAMVAAGDIAPFEFADNVKYFGAIYGYLYTVAGGTQFHYDRSLSGQVLEGKSQWVLINQGF